MKIRNFGLALLPLLALGSCGFKESNNQHQFVKSVTCPKPESVQLIPFQSGTSFKIGEGSWPLEVTSLQAVGGNVETVVLSFSGGPGLQFDSGNTKKRIEALFSNNHTLVLLSEHSGNISDNNTKLWRMRKFGLRAFDCDRIQISELVKALKENYPNAKVIVHGASLSGLLAMKLAGFEQVDGLILVAPWTHYVTFEEIKAVGVSAFLDGDLVDFENPETKERHLARDIALFKIDETKLSDPGRGWMEESRAAFAKDPVHTIVIHGERENRTDLQASVDYFSSISAVEMEIVPRAIHEVMMIRDETKQAIVNFRMNIERP